MYFAGINLPIFSACPIVDCGIDADKEKYLRVLLILDLVVPSNSILDAANSKAEINGVFF